MSRIGNKQIDIPAGVSVSINSGGRFGHQQVAVTGPKGTMQTDMRHGINAVLEGAVLTFTRDNETKPVRSLHGLYRALAANMVTGVVEGFKKELELVGIGYRGEMQGEKAVFSLGFSHKKEVTPPAGVTITIQDQTLVAVEGMSKELVGKVADQIRALRPPEPYKGKGIRYKGEHVRRKSVKKAA